MEKKFLIDSGSKWLKNHPKSVPIPSCDVVVTNLTNFTSMGEKPDVIGWCSWRSGGIVLDVVLSKEDLVIESSRWYRKVPSFGVGELRFFLCPENVLGAEDVLEDWGLLWCDGEGNIKAIKNARRQTAHSESEREILKEVRKQL